MSLMIAKLFIRLLVQVSVVTYSFNVMRSPSFSTMGTSGLINSPRHTLQLHGIAERMSGLMGLLSGQSTITEKNIEDTLKEVKSILVDADVNLQVANSLIKKVKEKAIGMQVVNGQKPGDQFIGLLAEELMELMGKENAPLAKRKDSRPTTVLMLGLQGAGKTTATAKLAKLVLKQKHSEKVLLVAADTYRPAAIEQLKTLGQRLGVDVYTEDPTTSNPVKIAKNAFQKAKDEGYDMVIIDTAGRQVVDDKLMQELKLIKSAILPDESLLVVDAMTGQEAATLTLKFNEEIGITGAVLTKLDGDTRGGSAVSVRAISGKPIKFIGVGEGLDDLEAFYPDRMATRVLGLGDLKTLVEKAQASMKIDDVVGITQRMQTGTFSFDDYIAQLNQVKSIGGLGAMLKMMPGGAGAVSDEMLFQAEKKIKFGEKIVNAMTAEERANPDLLCPMTLTKQNKEPVYERKMSLSERSGVPFDQLDSFLASFNEMRSMMRKTLKNQDLEKMKADPNAMVQLGGGKAAKKAKMSRGGGSGFGKS